MKTELLVQMDGLKGIKSDEQIFVMAASNTPWDLDIAVLVRN
jgi:katanin p60 ATPase-containing subunit A1